jgi:hypothetical protein
MDVTARLGNDAVISLTINDNVAGGDFDFYGHGRLTAYGDGGLVTADWTGYMIREAEEIWIERDGRRERLEPGAATVDPDAAFVATVLDGAPNICPACEAARVVALTEAACASADKGRVIEVEPC